ncbi:hypothetical protein [Alicyclobacillus macrosporangiidus]|uniref:Uncharacterized protein n=1 Tax=Alicyclobacillus macrosporangiidus TaxID=392015 RepID=A0A1I7IEA3_9BACL|nr:hypothetical protein [Alicyclobacillus macrosporangiidus]SFU71190.1 hypothetical protein SAMN05421543_106165 [Alicyclobacillus macrosporangiidus]
MIETIKEYLVSLGFQVDNNSFGQANKAVKSIEKGLAKIAPAAVASFAKASLAMAGLVTATVAGTAKFLDSLGNQQIQMEMLARQMWTTQQQAQAFSATLRAMGTNLQALYLSPTLMQQYQQLNALALQMQRQMPSDYTEQIQMVQSVSLQFKQMRLEAYYALQWIGYYFIKYMAGPIGSVRNALQSLNTIIIKNMPSWTKHVAEVMASFMQAGVYIVSALSSVYHWLQTILSYMPGWSKGVIAAIAALGIALAANPFGQFMFALGAVVVLLDDFETYIHGGKAALGPLWQWLMKVTDGLKQFGNASSIGERVRSAFEALGKTFQDVAGWFKNMVKTLSDNGTFAALGHSVKDVADAVDGLIKSIGHLFGVLTNSQNKSDLENFGMLMIKVVEIIVKTIAMAIEEVAGLVGLVSDVLRGNWQGAWNDIKSMLTGQNLANAGIISPHFVAGAMGPPIGPPSFPYMFKPAANTTTTTNNNVTINQTNHIQATDPQGTVNAIQNQMTPILMQNLRGMVR